MSAALQQTEGPSLVPGFPGLQDALELNKKFQLGDVVKNMNEKTLSVFLKAFEPSQIAEICRDGQYGLRPWVPDSVVITDKFLDPNNPYYGYVEMKEKFHWHLQDAKKRGTSFKPALLIDGSNRDYLGPVLRGAYKYSVGGSRLPSLESLWTNQFLFHVADPKQVDAMLGFAKDSGLGAENATLTVSCKDGWDVGTMASIVFKHLKNEEDSACAGALEDTKNSQISNRSDAGTCQALGPSTVAGGLDGQERNMRVGQALNGTKSIVAQSARAGKRAGPHGVLSLDTARYFHLSFEGADLRYWKYDDDDGDEPARNPVQAIEEATKLLTLGEETSGEKDGTIAIMDDRLVMDPAAEQSDSDLDSYDSCHEYLSDSGTDDSDEDDEKHMAKLRIRIAKRYAATRRPLQDGRTDGPVTAVRCGRSVVEQTEDGALDWGNIGYPYSQIIDAAEGRPVVFVVPDGIHHYKTGWRGIEPASLLEHIAKTRDRSEKISNYTASHVFAVSEKDYGRIEEAFNREEITTEQLTAALVHYSNGKKQISASDPTQSTDLATVD